MKKISIGIDFSKKTFDATIIRHEEDCFNELAYNKFDNDTKGFKAFEKWVGATLRSTPEAKDSSKWVFCGEHTGVCSTALCDFLVRKSYLVWLESALVIKRKCGIVRDKNDRTDSRRIAEFALRNFSNDVRPYELDSDGMKKLKALYTAHGILTRDKVAKINQIKSGALDDCPGVLKEFEKQLENISEALEDIDAQILRTLRDSEEFSRNYEILSSFKGAGPITAAYLIIRTRNFRDMRDSREQGCCIGVVPHGQQSGTSVNRAPRTSRYRDRDGNAVITNCANSAVRHNPVIKAYYHRLLERGVNVNKAKNNCKFKIINILLAMIRNNTTFDIEKYGKARKEWPTASGSSAS